MIFRRLSFYLAILGLAAGFVLVRRLRQQPPPPPPVAEPTRSPYDHFVAAAGIIEARRENVAVAAPRPGLVTKVMVEVGTDVADQQPLLQLDAREAEARLFTAKAQFDSLSAARTVEEVAIADWTDQFERTQRLQEQAVATEDERKRKWFTLEAAKARLRRIDAEIAAAQAQIHQAQVELDVLTIRAPRDGRILQLNVRAGEYATTTTERPLLILGDVKALQIRADVDEQNAPQVVAGRPATAFLKGDNQRPMPLRFVRIEPYVVPKRSLTGDSSERVDTRVLQIIFEMTPPAFPIYVGQQVDVFIECPASRDQERQP
ncbi:MAG: efflux RND transporter periplasmic adaptor subunit [Verrucomicrobiales bacterium]|nr:efflux RND transporter periplasmic adaptor subunit [Verrucomicrobiales bacterium]